MAIYAGLIDVSIIMLLMQIRIYDLGEHQGYKCLHKIDVANEVDKLRNSPPEDGTTSGRGILSHVWSCDFINYYTDIDAAIITNSPQWKQNSLVITSNYCWHDYFTN